MALFRRRPEPTPPASAEQLGAPLEESSVVLGGAARDRDEAIAEVGALLVAAGAVEPSYVDAMHAREAAVSTFMGNGLALPHGDAGSVEGVRRTAIALVRHDTPLDWGGEPVRFVVGLAGRGSEHLTLIGSLARVFTDDARIARLAAATTPAEVLAVLGED